MRLIIVVLVVIPTSASVGSAKFTANGQSASELVMRLIIVVLVVIPTSAAAAGALVVLLDDRRADALDLLLLLLDLLRVGLRVARQPVLPILDGIVDSLLLVLVHLLPEALVLARTLNRGLHGMDVSVESIARVDALLRQLVFLRELLRFPDHLLDLLLRQPALVVRDRDLLGVARAFVIGRSPSYTWIVTVGWLSWFVEKTWLFFVGITVFRVMSLVMTPPTVSIPSDRGVTSRRRRSEPP